MTTRVEPFFPSVPDGYASPWPSLLGRLADAQYVARRVIGLARIAASYDVVLLQRVLLPPWLLHVLRRRVRVLVFDFDDAIYTVHEGARPPHGDLTAHFTHTVRSSDAVIASTPVLAARASAIQSRVVTLPSPIDCHRYRPRASLPGPPRRPVAGWIGSASTTMYVERLMPLLKRLAGDSGGLCVEMVGARLKDDSGGVRVHSWSLETEKECLAGFDIGLMPLVDDEWARGKAGYKLLQYMACGLPSVASPVGANVQIVRQGETGFLAESLDEWEDCLRRLADDAALRERMGCRAREIVEQEYSLERWAPVFCDTIESCGRIEA